MRELDEKLLNIIDMKFLHGYYEPTLLILFEPNQTWPGSVFIITASALFDLPNTKVVINIFKND